MVVRLSYMTVVYGICNLIRQILLLMLDVQKPKNLTFRGFALLTPDQGLYPWTPL